MLKRFIAVISVFYVVLLLTAPNIIAGEKLNFNRILVEESVGAGLGFIGGMVTMGIYMAVAGEGKASSNMRTSDYINSFVIGSMASSAFGVYYIGKFGGDEGSYPITLAGSLGGTLLGYFLGVGKDKSFALYAILIPLLQSTGGMIGFNLPRFRNAFISSDEKGVALGIPRVYFSEVPEDSRILMAKVDLLKLKF